MSQHGTRQLEFRSSRRRQRGLGLSFYKHFTPNGVEQHSLFIHMDQRFEERLLASNSEFENQLIND